MFVYELFQELGMSFIEKENIADKTIENAKEYIQFLRKEPEYPNGLKKKMITKCWLKTEKRMELHTTFHWID